MGIIGGIIGAVIGGMFAGHWGAVIGGGIGYTIGNLGDSPKQQPQPEQPGNSYDRVECEEDLFSAMGALAKADGRVSPEEAEFVSQIIRSWGQDQEERTRFKEAFDRGKRDVSLFGVFFSKYFIDLSENYKRGTAVLEVLCSLARADGKISQRERDMLYQAEMEINRVGFVDSFFDSSDDDCDSGPDEGDYDSGDSGSPGLDECYKILDVSSSAGEKEVTDAWRRKSKEFHPDKVQATGLSESFIVFAENQMKKINQAYETIKAARGWK
ncbi:MAG: TerB family tellurite resistance protein [Victivallaceae bacterium]|nr:TerB family tellurite resistance protein [Victivallaceae bacterium]